MYTIEKLSGDRWIEIDYQFSYVKGRCVIMNAQDACFQAWHIAEETNIPHRVRHLPELIFINKITQ